jgi:hypothetical protein
VKECEWFSAWLDGAVAMQRLQRLFFTTTEARRNSTVVDPEAAFEVCSYFMNDVAPGK